MDKAKDQVLFFLHTFTAMEMRILWMNVELAQILMITLTPLMLQSGVWKRVFIEYIHNL